MVATPATIRISLPLTAGFSLAGWPAVRGATSEIHFRRIRTDYLLSPYARARVTMEWDLSSGQFHPSRRVGRDGNPPTIALRPMRWRSRTERQDSRSRPTRTWYERRAVFP